MAETVSWSVNIEGVPGVGMICGMGDTPANAMADAKAKLAAVSDSAAAQAASVERAQVAVESTDVTLPPIVR